MSYTLTFYVYLDGKNGPLLCLHVLDYICKKVGNGLYNNSMKVVTFNIRKLEH